MIGGSHLFALRPIDAGPQRAARQPSLARSRVEPHTTSYNHSVLCLNTYEKKFEQERLQTHQKASMTDFSIASSTSTFTSAQVLATMKHYVSSTVDDIRQGSTPETYFHCIIFISMMKEFEVNDNVHKDDDLHTQSASPRAWRLRGTLPASLLDFRRSRFREYRGARQKDERILGSKTSTDSSPHIHNLVTQFSQAPPSSSRAPSHKKGDKIASVSTRARSP